MGLFLLQKKIIVTGAFGVLGAATARRAADAGAHVALVDQGATPPAGLVEECGSEAVVVSGTDLTAVDKASDAIGKAASALGGIDALINIAGAFRWQTVTDGNPLTWDLLFAVNLKTALNSSRAALHDLSRSTAGRIVNIGANTAIKASAGMGAYAASKAAVHRLTESLAEELKSQRITVNAVLPSIIDTPANRSDMPQADFSTWVTPEALADVILFLVSDEAQAITGSLLPVTGRV